MRLPPKNTIIMLLLTAWIIGGEPACIKKEVAVPVNTTSQTLISTLQDNYSFSLFYYALQKTGLDRLLTDTSSYTLLVPDNDAFGRDSILTDSDLNVLDTAYLRQWLSYHILPGAITSASVPQSVNNPYSSISGQTLYFSRPVPSEDQKQSSATLHINGDTVNTLDLTASNGVIQVMNRPLKLPVASVQAYLSSHAQYSLLVIGLQHFGLWDSLTGAGPFTIWAPNNNAFAAVGITPDSVAKLDTTRFQLSLFRIDVLTPARVFMTDFSDIPTSSVLFAPNNGPYWIQTAEPSYGQPLPELVNYYGPTQGFPIPWTDPDNIAVNGVVQGIGLLILNPDQTTK